MFHWLYVMCQPCGISLTFFLTGKGPPVVYPSLKKHCNNHCAITSFNVPGKMLAHLLLLRIESYLFKFQRREESRFAPVKSITERILGLHVLMER